jgi:hypothetical protein
MTDEPDRWSDTDTAELPEQWQDEDTDDGMCDRCGHEINGPDGIDPDYCEDCERVIRRRRNAF